MTDHLYLFKEEASFSHGVFENVVWRDGCLTLLPEGGKYALRGVYTTPEVKAPAFSALAGSWNACVPDGCAVELWARAACGGRWSSWMRWGAWSPFARRACPQGQGDALASLSGDTLCIADANGADAFQLRISLFGTGEGTPCVYLLAAALQTLQMRPEAGAPVQHRTVPVPAYALHVHDERLARRAFLPAVCTMLINRWGEDVLPEEAAYACYDYGSGSYGNRAFACALAGAYGFESYSVFTDAEGLKREIKNGFGCGVRVRAGFGAPDAPQRMVAARGFETDADGTEFLLVNDPLAPDDTLVPARWPLAAFLASWDGSALLVHRRRDKQRPCGPMRSVGELRRTEIPGEFALYLKGSRYSLPIDLCGGEPCTGTICYTVRDEHAYATTAHKRFYYTSVSASGNILLDTMHMPAGTKLTVYVIAELGKMTIASLTI